MPDTMVNDDSAMEHARFYTMGLPPDPPLRVRSPSCGGLSRTGASSATSSLRSRTKVRGETPPRQTA
jgi:hypothetical protein